jgi:hypothetical protein
MVPKAVTSGGPILRGALANPGNALQWNAQNNAQANLYNLTLSGTTAGTSFNAAALTAG